MRDTDKLARLQSIISGSPNILFFVNDSVSTESGIPDFRSVDGLYNQQYDYPPEEILSYSFYRRNKAEFYRFHRAKMLPEGIKPNPAHQKLAELEKAGKLKAVITQNIDGLHQLAGSQTVVELHGNVHRNFCESCGKLYDSAYVRNSEGIPRCEACGGDIKPDVVLYEEPLNDRSVMDAVRYISEADTLIIGGTSLAVWPAAGLVDYFTGRNLVVINREPPQKSTKADLTINDSIGKVLGAITV